jgi:hypothetical protein
MPQLDFPSTPTPGQVYAAPTGVNYTWDSTLGVWTASASGGGGVVPVAATLPQAAAGLLNTVFSSPETAVPKDAAGMTGAAIIPGGTSLQQPASPTAGMFRYNSDSSTMEFYDGAAWVTLGAGGGAGGVTSITVSAPITDTGTATAPIIGISAATTATSGSVQLATSTEAATGTDATKALTPATGVPKTSANMAGAALIPGGNNAARPGTPATGMLRFNSQTSPAVMEYYDGSAWTTLASGPIMNKVIFGTGNVTATGTTFNHAAVPLSSSYVVLNNGGGASVDIDAYVSARSSTGFTVRAPGGTGTTVSYFIVYS